VADRFESLVASVQGCRKCATMEGRRRVLGTGNGATTGRVMLVGEAPGRLGAEQSGIPFTGDASGRRLDLLLAAAGWERSALFITNAVLCNPRDARGRNRAPTSLELDQCRDHLARTLEIVKPALVVALGRRAAMALGHIRPHELGSAAPGELLAWTHPVSSWIAWVLHPSPLTQTHRSFETQQADWRRLRWAFDRLPALHRGIQHEARNDQSTADECAWQKGGERR
jgi:uracil-DNA glycosylase family 4